VRSETSLIPAIRFHQRSRRVSIAARGATRH
jgi:hypothetical protein